MLGSFSLSLCCLDNLTPSLVDNGSILTLKTCSSLRKWEGSAKIGRVTKGALYPLDKQPEQLHFLPSFRILFFISSSNCIIRPMERSLAYLLFIKDINSSRAAFPLNIIDQHWNITPPFRRKVRSVLFSNDLPLNHSAFVVWQWPKTSLLKIT